jgi:RND family efflux transporter MFP subunit
MKKLKIKPLVAFIIVFVVLLIGAIVFFLTKEKPVSENPVAGPKPALTVTTVLPVQMPLPIKLSANGNVEAWQEASIGSELNGLKLAEVLVNVGERVQKGQVLARFAAESVEADLAQARASLLEAEANETEAIANADRVRKLETTGALSAQEIARYYTTEQAAKARSASAKAALAAQQLRMKYVSVVAPDDGIISDRKATVGAVANVGTELFRMIRQGRLEWRAEVTSAELGRINSGTHVSVLAANGIAVPGKVRVVAPTVNPDNRNALVYVDLKASPDKNASVKAGMFARGEFDLGVSTALTVPLQAVVLREGFSYVFFLNQENRVVQAKVKTGRRISDRVEILEGLKPEVRVITTGAGFLNDGDLVRVADASEQTPAKVQTQPAALKR